MSSTVESSPRKGELPYLTKDTPQSSVTMLAEGPRSINAEAVDDERRIHAYGGDDTHAPDAKPSPGAPAPVFKMPTPDPNMVTWDGPDDPENPQNWSQAKKWLG
jgi:hypothetical protein